MGADAHPGNDVLPGDGWYLALGSDIERCNLTAFSMTKRR